MRGLAVTKTRQIQISYPGNGRKALLHWRHNSAAGAPAMQQKEVLSLPAQLIICLLYTSVLGVFILFLQLSLFGQRNKKAKIDITGLEVAAACLQKAQHSAVGSGCLLYTSSVITYAIFVHLLESV